MWGLGGGRHTVAGEVRSRHVLDGNLLQEGRLLAARVSAHHPRLLQPGSEPGQVTVTHVGVGQQVAVCVCVGRGEQEHKMTRYHAPEAQSVATCTSYVT